MSQDAVNPYDEVPYESHPFPESHPERLATLGTLFGMTPAPIERCRVLELGCGDGGNLIPMAANLADSEFVGIDSSGTEISAGRETVEALGLGNIRLVHQDLVDVDDRLGRFDYIIAHGVFSWVPPLVRESLLGICRRGLNPQGIAYISYNTYPGWHVRRMIRDMMRFHVRALPDTKTRIQQARAIVKFVAESASAEGAPHAAWLDDELKRLGGEADDYILHEYLSDENQPVYFHEFVEMAARHGLRYLSDAHFHTMVPGNFSAGVAEALRPLSNDEIALEQYMDFLRNRAFRSSLVCRQEVPVRRSLSAASFVPLLVASSMRPASARPDFAARAEERFASDRTSLVSADPLAKAAFVVLWEAWPQCEPFPTVLAKAQTRLPGSAYRDRGPLTAKESEEILARAIWECFARGAVELHVRRFPFVSTVDERPVASPLARLQAKSRAWVTNQRHELVNIGGAGRHLLPHLDGTHDRSSLLGLWTDLNAQGALGIGARADVAQDAAQARPVLAQSLEALLAKACRWALLIGEEPGRAGGASGGTEEEPAK
jgi:methyltransferase-like protein/SAM-dependent methyltransferase